MWEPEDYERTPYETPAPIVDSPEAAIREYVRCSRSLSYFAFTHAWSLHVDDLGGMPVWRKFPTYPYLRRFFAATEKPDNTLVEKSRQMLMSWAWMVVFLWDILFKRNWGNMVLSRRKTEVDDGGFVSSHDSLLGKVRHIWLALPPYLQAPLDFHYMVVRHQAVNSYIRGETGTQKAGRGRATKRALMDEAAYLDHSESIFKGLRQAAKGGLALTSTPNGKGNVFARLRFAPHTTFKKLSFHWTEHPDKAKGLYCTCGWMADDSLDVTNREQFLAHDCLNAHKNPPGPPEARSPWYDHETRDMTPEGVASELDISYEKSRRGRVFSMFDSTRQVFDHTLLVGEILERESVEGYRQRYLEAILKPGFQPVVGWDFGVDDPTSLVLGQVLNEETMEIEWIDEFEERGKSWEFYHTWVNDAWAPVVKRQTGLDILHYGDPSGKNRESDLKSWVVNLGRERDRGDGHIDPPIKIIHEPKRGSLLEWIDFVHNIIRKNYFKVSSWNTGQIDALGNYHYPTDENGEPVAGKHLPVHDGSSHVMSAMRYVYQFRWWRRLTDLHHKGVKNKQIISAGEGNLPEKQKPPVDSSSSYRYFRDQ